MAKKTPKTVRIVNSSYQPNKAELEEDMRVNVSFEDAVDALARPVQIEYVDTPDSA